MRFICGTRWWKTSLGFALMACLLGGAFGVGLSEQGKWELAARKVQRLRPSAFPELPVEIREKLDQAKCLVPQSFGDEKPHNLMRGEFARKGQLDWAALCSTGGKSTILMFWGKPTACPSRLAAQDDSNYVQLVAPERVEFSRMISAVDAEFIRVHYESYGGTKPPATVDHLGIDDRYLEKGSVVHYCHNGKWLRLAGAD